VLKPQENLPTVFLLAYLILISSEKPNKAFALDNYTRRGTNRKAFLTRQYFRLLRHGHGGAENRHFFEHPE